VGKVGAFERGLLSELKASGGILDSIRSDKQITKDVEAKLIAFLDDFTKRFSQG
jgi:F-type H+-transporting ATPase subunit alpha